MILGSSPLKLPRDLRSPGRTTWPSTAFRTSSSVKAGAPSRVPSSVKVSERGSKATADTPGRPSRASFTLRTQRVWHSSPSTLTEMSGEAAPLCSKATWASGVTRRLLSEGIFENYLKLPERWGVYQPPIAPQIVGPARQHEGLSPRTEVAAVYLAVIPHSLNHVNRKVCR